LTEESDDDGQDEDQNADDEEDPGDDDDDGDFDAPDSPRRPKNKAKATKKNKKPAITKAAADKGQDEDLHMRCKKAQPSNTTSGAGVSTS
jgi:hypothetical protein